MFDNERQAMKAVLYQEFKGAMTYEDVPDPIPEADGVVVAVKANGICRSDWHGWQGHDDAITSLPHVPGHELAGEVVAVGANVTRWRIGDRVTVPFSMGCGTCPQCNAGNQQICDQFEQPGFTRWGAFAEYVALPYADVNLVRVPESLSYVDVAALGCRFVTAFRGLTARAGVQAGEWVVVHGCGGVGLSAVMIANAMGAHVIAVDINPDALALAQSVGAVYTLNAGAMSQAELIASIHDLTQGGAHVSLDALGSPVTAHNSIMGLRKRGRHVQVGLLVGENSLPPIPMGVVLGKELDILGSHGIQAHAYPELLRLVTSDKMDLSALVKQRVHLREAPAIIEAMTDYKTLGITVIDDFSS
jgi:alcohol dehydrogenase